jgi:hypothetical protein
MLCAPAEKPPRRINAYRLSTTTDAIMPALPVERRIRRQVGILPFPLSGQCESHQIKPDKPTQIAEPVLLKPPLRTKRPGGLIIETVH